MEKLSREQLKKITDVLIDLVLNIEDADLVIDYMKRRGVTEQEMQEMGMNV